MRTERTFWRKAELSLHNGRFKDLPGNQRSRQLSMQKSGSISRGNQGSQTRANNWANSEIQEHFCSPTSVPYICAFFHENPYNKSSSRAGGPEGWGGRTPPVRGGEIPEGDSSCWKGNKPFSGGPGEPGTENVPGGLDVGGAPRSGNQLRTVAGSHLRLYVRQRNKWILNKWRDLCRPAAAHCLFQINKWTNTAHLGP